MKQISLNDQLAVLIDDEDFDRLQQFHWYPEKRARNTYARTSQPRKMRMAALLMGTVGTGKIVKFRDGNSLNCQKANLEVLEDCRESGRGLHKRIKRGKKHKGVYFLKRRNHWKAMVSLPAGGREYIGYYESEDEAIEAYEKRFLELYGKKEEIIG